MIEFWILICRQNVCDIQSKGLTEKHYISKNGKFEREEKKPVKESL